MAKRLRDFDFPVFLRLHDSPFQEDGGNSWFLRAGHLDGSFQLIDVSDIHSDFTSPPPEVARWLAPYLGGWVRLSCDDSGEISVDSVLPSSVIFPEFDIPYGDVLVGYLRDSGDVDFRNFDEYSRMDELSEAEQPASTNVRFFKTSRFPSMVEWLSYSKKMEYDRY